MRLSLSLNGTVRVVASLPKPGYLSGHLNMQDRPKEGDGAASVVLNGHQTDDTETIHFEWPRFELHTGDVVELKLLPDGDGDPPSETRRLSELPSNLLSSTELAEELLAIVSTYDRSMEELLDKAKKTEPADEYQKLSRAVAAAACEIGDRLLYPIYRRHKELIPDALRGELL